MRIILESRDELRVVNLTDILYLQASRNYTDFHFTDGRVKSELGNLSEFEAKVNLCFNRDDSRNTFVRIGRSFLINTSHVELISLRLQKIAFQTTPPIYLSVSKNMLSMLKQIMSQQEK